MVLHFWIDFIDLERGRTMRLSCRRLLGRRLFGLTMVATLLAVGAVSAQQAGQSGRTSPDLNFPTVLYGAAYYNEYMPGDQVARLDKDVALMKSAGLNVVRMGESTWSLWEPQDGQFEYAWMDRVVDAMGKAGIKVILGPEPGRGRRRAGCGARSAAELPRPGRHRGAVRAG